MVRQGLNLRLQNKNVLVCHKCGHPLWIWRDGSGLSTYCPRCHRKFERLSLKKVNDI